MSALILDVEATGLVEPEVVEAAWMRAGDPREPFDPLKAEQPNVARYRPSKPIAVGALAAHWILDEELADCPPSADFRLPEDTRFIVGHNIDYDWEAIGKPQVHRICTLALARAKWPTLDSHRLEALIFHLDRAHAREILTALPAHSAAHDVLLCRMLLHHLVPEGVATWGDLWRASEEARIPTHFPFGKHHGTAITETPRDYREWCLRQSDMDPYVLKAVRRSLYGKETA